MTTLGKYDERGVPLLAWLLRMARNAAIDHLRANRMLPTEIVFDADASSVTDCAYVAEHRPIPARRKRGPRRSTGEADRAACGTATATGRWRRRSRGLP